MLQFSIKHSFEYLATAIEEVSIVVNLKFGVNPSSKRKVNKNVATESKQDLKAVVQRCSVKKVFLEISQNSQENICARVSFLIKLQASLQLY